MFAPIENVLGVLTNRELAVAVWAAALLAWASRSRDVRASSGPLVRAAAAPKLLLLFVVAARYCAALVFAAHGIGAWHIGALKETVYAFGGVLVLLFGAANAADDLEFFANGAR